MKSEGIGYITSEVKNGKKYWKGNISLGYDKDGKQIRKSKSSFKKKVVVDWLKKYSSYEFTSESEEPLIKNVDRFIELHKKPPKTLDVTYERYIQRTNDYLRTDALADMITGQISKSQIQLYANRLLEKASVPIVEYMLSLIRAVYRDLREDNKVEINPVKDIVLPKYTPKEREYLTDKEQKQILSELQPMDNKRDLGIFLALSTGLRLGEIMGLQWSDIDNGILHITKQCARIRKGQTGIKDTKTHKSIRDVALPSITNKILENQRSVGYIFSDDGLKPFDRKRVQRRYKQICAKYNIDSTFHCTRHTFATNMLEEGVSIYTLKDFLGHESISTTLIYGDITSKLKKESVEKINRKLKVIDFKKKKSV